jgi:hypothetical protein
MATAIPAVMIVSTPKALNVEAERQVMVSSLERLNRTELLIFGKGLQDLGAITTELPLGALDSFCLSEEIRVRTDKALRLRPSLLQQIGECLRRAREGNSVLPPIPAP